jgi:hypothetical protein
LLERENQTSAKPLGPKSTPIREAIQAHPEMGNTELEELINASDARREDKIKVKPGDIAAHKQAMKKSGTAPTPVAQGGKKDGGQCGGVANLKLLVDRLANMQRW